MASKYLCTSEFLQDLYRTVQLVEILDVFVCALHALVTKN